MKEKILNILFTNLKLHPSRVKCIYLFGSRVYGISNDMSDYDFTIIANNSVENIEHTFGEYNFHIYTIDYFNERLNWNDPESIECLMYPPIYESQKFEVDIINSKYRHAVSYIASNSFVKAKKKILQGDIYVGQKSLFHSLRIPLYAIQIMTYNDIRDWEVANMYWEDIKLISDWEILKEKYQPIKNSIMSEFRNLCPKL